MLLNLELLHIDSDFLENNSIFATTNERKKFKVKSTEEKYEFLKLLQGEIQAFYLLLRPKVEDEQLIELNQLVSAVRHSIYAAKSMKDIKNNIGDLSRSSKNSKFNLLALRQKQTETLYQFLNSICISLQQPDLQKLQGAYSAIENNYSEALNDFYKDPQTALLENIDLTTIINFNRELLSANKAMILAVKDLLLNQRQNLEFENSTM